MLLYLPGGLEGSVSGVRYPFWGLEFADRGGEEETDGS